MTGTTLLFPPYISGHTIFPKFCVSGYLSSGSQFLRADLRVFPVDFEELRLLNPIGGLSLCLSIGLYRKASLQGDDSICFHGLSLATLAVFVNNAMTLIESSVSLMISVVRPDSMFLLFSFMAFSITKSSF